MGWIASKKVQVSKSLLAGYQILEKIGKGSTGTVYKARNQRTGKTVAIKVIPGEVASDPVQRMRFAQECQVTKQLNHPHIVRVLDFGLEGDRAYMVMEFVDGESLGDRLERKSRLPEGEAIRIITQIGQALHLAHKRRLVHRDVKPDNILLTAAGVAKLADLGFVKNLEGDYELTRTKSCLGTPNFMAPEQFEDAKRASARSDLYSLAATLYMTVTGELPFRTKNVNAVATMYKLQKANDITAPRKLVPMLSPHVEQAILPGMRADPSERFENVEEFLAALKTPDAQQAEPEPELIVAEGPPESTCDTPSGELRSSERYACKRVTSCQAMQWALDENWFGEVVNISETGVCLQLPRRFEPGAILTISLDGGANRRRSVLVRVVWVQQATKKTWRLGCKYDQPLCDFEVQDLRS